MALIAHITFWIALVVTTVESGWRRALIFLALWLAGYVMSGAFGPAGSFLFGSYVAVLALVLLFLLKFES
jgi:hypothetical protein